MQSASPPTVFHLAECDPFFLFPFRFDLLCVSVSSHNVVCRTGSVNLYFRGRGRGQSSSPVSLRAKRYFLRSSVIYSESCRVCDRPPPASLTRLAVDVCTCAFLTAKHVFLGLSLVARCAEVMRTERREEERGPGHLLSFPVLSPCLHAWGVGLSP